MSDISVRFLHNEEIRKYSLDFSANVHNLKEKISNDLDIPIELITLKRSNDELSNDTILSSLDCSNCEFIVIINDLVCVIIKSNLETFDFVNSYSTHILKSNKVSILKEKLSKLLNIPTEIISLKFNDHVLDNSKYFKDYNINEETELIFGLNLFILKPSKTDKNRFIVSNEFIDRNIFVSDLIENYCNENNLNKDFNKFQYENIILSNESVVDLIKTSTNPMFRVINAARISYRDKDNNVIEVFLFHYEPISKLRERIKSKSDMFEGNEILLYNNKILEDNKTLQFYGENDYYQVISGFELLVKCDDISIISPVFVHNSMSIKCIKHQFAESLDIEWMFINLLIDNNKLDDNKTIKFYGITKTTCIDLKIGINIIIFLSDDLIEYLVKPDTTFQDVKQYISYKYKIDLEYIKLVIADKEVKPADNLVEIAKSNNDTIISVKPKLDICILHENGSKSSYKIWDKSRIYHLKELISANTRILKESIALLIGSEELDDEKTIDFYKIDEKSEIRMLVQNRVAIIDEQQNFHCVIIEPSDSILDLKKMLSLKIKQNDLEIHIYHEQMYLEDHQTIHSYNIDFNSLLEMKLGVRVRLVDENNKNYELVLPKMSTVISLKNLLCAHYNLEMDKFNLIFSDMELTDDLLIENFKFDDDSVIKIITKSTPVSIYVCNLTNDFQDFDIITVVVKTDDTIKNIKKQILDKYNIDMDTFTLTFLGENLDDGKCFHQFEIENNNSVMVKTKMNKCCEITTMGIVINVKEALSDNPRIFKYLLDDYQSIAILKQKLRDELNVSVDKIKLIFAGKELDNTDTIRSLDLDNDSTIMMVIKKEEIHNNENLVKVKIKFSFLHENDESFKEQEINPSKMVISLKEQISNELGMQTNSFVLMYNEEIMVDKNSLSIYELVDGSEIVVCNSIFVKSFSGQSLDTATVRRVPVQLTDTVEALQRRISRKLNIQSSFIKLNFQGEYLNEDTIIKDTEIENESFLMMITTLKGG